MTCSYKWFVEHELDARSGSSRPPTRCGSARSSTTRSTGSTASRRAPTRSRGPATSTTGSGASASCSTRPSPRSGGPAQPRPPRGARARPGPGRGVPRRRGRDRDRVPPSPRPAGGRLRSVRRRGGAGARAAAARRRRAARAHRPDRRRRDRAAPSCATTRPARTSPRRTSSTRGGKAPDPALHAGRRADPGPRRRSGASTTRSARSASASRAGSSPARTRTSRGSGSSAPTGSSTMTSSSRSTRPRSSRRDSAAEMRAGEIRRHPIGGQVPQVLQLPGDLPARAGDRRRRERQRRMSALDGQLSLTELEPAAPEPRARRRATPHRRRAQFEPTAEQRDAIAARERDTFLEAGAGIGQDHGPRRPLLRRGRRRRRRGRPDPRVHVHRAGRCRDAHPRAPRADRQGARRCAPPATRCAPTSCRRRPGRPSAPGCSTIHAFCRRLLAQHPLAAGLDPRFRVLDASEAGRLADRAASRGARGPARLRRRGRRPGRGLLSALAAGADDARGAHAPAQPGDERAAAARGRRPGALARAQRGGARR